LTYQLLDAFAALFQGKKYFHRDSTQGDLVAMRLFEDLYSLNRSSKYKQRVDIGLSVLNAQNRRHGVKARRGDGTFGEVVPNVSPKRDPGFAVARGPIATIEIGIEVKILAKAMIKQIDRVMNDLEKQVRHFKTKGGNPITVGIVGINHADHYLSYEKDREYHTGGTSGYRHPIQEAAEAERRLIASIEPVFDEFLVLRFFATNQPPHLFSWVNAKVTSMDYGAALARISQQYEKRF
jgi:hypothetical protein